MAQRRDRWPHCPQTGTRQRSGGGTAIGGQQVPSGIGFVHGVGACVGSMVNVALLEQRSRAVTSKVTDSPLTTRIPSEPAPAGGRGPRGRDGHGAGASRSSKLSPHAIGTRSTRSTHTPGAGTSWLTTRSTAVTTGAGSQLSLAWQATVNRAVAGAEQAAAGEPGAAGEDGAAGDAGAVGVNAARGAGGVVSRTVTTCDCEATLPQSSLAVQVRVIV